jgi:hypothetical protein
MVSAEGAAEMDDDLRLAVENARRELASTWRALDADRAITAKLLAEGRAAMERSRELLRRPVFSPALELRDVVEAERIDPGSMRAAPHNNVLRLCR